MINLMDVLSLLLLMLLRLASKLFGYVASNTVGVLCYYQLRSCKVLCTWMCYGVGCACNPIHALDWSKICSLPAATSACTAFSV
jgi:hypothetical protein